MFSEQNVLAFIVAGRAFSVAHEIEATQNCDYVDVSIVTSTNLTDSLRHEANEYSAVGFEHHDILTGEPWYEILTSYFVDETVFIGGEANPWLLIVEAPQPNLTTEILIEAIDRLFLSPDIQSMICDEVGSQFAILSYEAFMHFGREALAGATRFQTV